MVRRIFTQQTTAFTINLSFGFMLKNVEKGELRQYHPSQNNARFLDAPHLIRTEEDLARYLDELSRHDMLEYIRQQYPDTKWVVHFLPNVTFYVNKINKSSNQSRCPATGLRLQQPWTKQADRWIAWYLHRQSLLLPLPGRTSWCFSERRRNFYQDIFSPISRPYRASLTRV